nr:Na-Ca exchanger/integrin-beta4 [uncultured bacterium]
MSTLLGKGDGTFAAAVSATVGKLPASLVAADLNGDGRSDLAVADNGSDTVSILTGKPDGSFLGALPLMVARPVSVAAGDFNGDGKIDLAVLNGKGDTVSVLLNTTAH